MDVNVSSKVVPCIISFRILCCQNNCQNEADGFLCITVASKPMISCYIGDLPFVWRSGCNVLIVMYSVFEYI